MDAYARQRLSKIAKVILVALTPQTQQVRVEDLGVMSKHRRDNFRESQRACRKIHDI